MGQDNSISIVMNIGSTDVDRRRYIFGYDPLRGLSMYLEINKLNCEVFINKEKKPFSNFYTFQEEGEYTIHLFLKRKIITAYNMFLNCSYVRKVDISNLATGSVEAVSWMFCNCTELVEIAGINKLLTANVKEMISVFNSCKQLLRLDLSSFNTENVENMAYMFYDCNSLVTIKGLDKFNTEKVTDMSYMFCNCYKLRSLDLSSFSVYKLKNLEYAFFSCYSLREIKGTRNWKNYFIGNVTQLFYECHKIRTLDLRNFNIVYNNGVGLFYYCEKVEEICLGDFEFTYANPVVNNKVNLFGDMFGGCYSLKRLRFKSLKISTFYDFDQCFRHCFSLETISFDSKPSTAIVDKLKEIFGDKIKIVYEL